MTAPTEQAHEPLTADTFEDSDSTFSGVSPVSGFPATSQNSEQQHWLHVYQKHAKQLKSETESLESLRSSVMRYQEENGRTYHAMSSGKYSFPNDESESDRLDLQHNLWLLTLHGELGLNPKIKGSTKRVLDAGTGTGIWAIEFADQHPEAQVIGVDLSPIQPSLVPPNCLFEIDDLEKEWTWTEPFDFVFARTMTGSFADVEGFIKNAYDNLEPGGYLEMQDLTYPIACDDGTLPSNSQILRSGQLSIEASAKLGRAINLAPKYKGFLEKAGFTEVVERQFKWPINEWPKDKHYKELGRWSYANINNGLEGLLLALFTRLLGWTADEVRVFCTAMRKELRDRSIHAYIPVYVVYGKKPLEEATSQA